GIEMLNPVVRDVAGWSYGDFVAGWMAGVRVGCAAVGSVARGEVRNGETIFLLTTLRSFGNDGLEAALRSLGRVDEVTLVDSSADVSDAFSQRRVEKPAYLPESTGLTSLTVLSPRVRFGGTLVESVQLSDAEKLLAAVGAAANVSNPSWTIVGRATPTVAPETQNQLASVADLLKSLADIPAVSG